MNQLLRRIGSLAALLFLAPAVVGAPTVGLAGQESASEPGRAASGQVRVRVELEKDSDPVGFLAEHGFGDRLLSERIGRVFELALTPVELDAVRAAGVQADVIPPEAADMATNPTAYTYAQMVSELQAMALAYPNIVRLTEFTNATHEGRTIYQLKLSDNVGIEEDEPTVLFLGVQHGGEMIGCDIIMFWLADTLAHYGSDPVKTAWIDDHEILVIPIANPDGWMNNETGLTSGWRKNKRDNNGSGSFETNADGVDLNRNYDFGWSKNGSGVPSSSIYRGPSPASEPETVVCQTLLTANKPVLALSWHMSGEIVFMPWTVNGMNTPDHAAYLAFTSSIASAIPRQSGIGTYAPVVESRFGGFVDDWIYGVTGGFCITPEVSWSPSVGPISNVVANNQNAFPVTFQRLTESQVTGHVTDARSGAPLPARVELLEIDTFELPPRTADASFGRYRWLTLSGAYTLRASQPGYHTQTVSNVSVGSSPSVVDVALVPHYAPYGNGLAGSGGIVPQLTGNGAPTIGSNVSIDLNGGTGGSFAVFAFSSQATSLPLFGGTLLVAPPLMTSVVLLNGMPGAPGAGSGSFLGAIPNDPNLSGQSFYFQAAVLDAGAILGKSLSAGLEMNVE